MRARPEVNAVAHAPHAVAFASLAQPLRPISTKGRCLSRLTSRAPPRQVIHGIVKAGESVETAVVHAILLERACHKQLLAMAAGELRTWSSDQEALAKRARVYSPEMIWTYLVRKAETSRGGGAS